MDRGKRLVLTLGIGAAALLAFVIVAAAGAFVLYRYHTGTPRYALAQAQKAVAQRDLLRFEAYVDVDRVADSLVSGLLAATAQHERRPRDAWGRLGEAFGHSLLGVMGSRLRQEIAADIRDGVRHGRTPDERRVVLKRLQRVEQEGDAATASYDVEVDGKPTTLVLRLVKGERYWRVVAVENADDLYRAAAASS
jgi:hypothetical protein